MLVLTDQMDLIISLQGIAKTKNPSWQYGSLTVVEILIHKKT